MYRREILKESLHPINVKFYTLVNVVFTFSKHSVMVQVIRFSLDP